MIAPVRGTLCSSELLASISQAKAELRAVINAKDILALADLSEGFSNDLKSEKLSFANNI